jgi:hypothetical protein
VGSNPTSHTLCQRLWDFVTWSLFLLFVLVQQKKDLQCDLQVFFVDLH